MPIIRFPDLTLAAVLLGMAACTSQEHQTVDLLNRRLNTTLGPDIAANHVALTPTPHGTTVTFLDPTSTPAGAATADPSVNGPWSSMVQGLLDPFLMRLSITDTANPTSTRAADMETYLRSFELGDSLAPAAAPPIGPAGLTVQITVACPHRPFFWGYDSGRRKPDCF